MKIEVPTTRRPGRTALLIVLTLVILPAVVPSVIAQNNDSLETYSFLSRIANGDGDTRLYGKLNTESRSLNWAGAETSEFKGNLRMLEIKSIQGSQDATTLFLIRQLDGRIYVLSRPEDADDRYADLHKMIQDKMLFSIELTEGPVDGQTYEFARFRERPVRSTLDAVFEWSIILMLFFVMVGMGLTLTGRDFAVVFKKPWGVIVGEVLQFGVMPLIAVGLGYVMGFREHYPFVFVGMILIAVTPGGVTSNLMTHYAKGDVALSVSLTSISTVLSLIFVPLLLGAYGSNIPEVTIPFDTIVLTIVVLVVAPLAVGMLVRAKFESFAKRSVRFFSILGIVALLFLIVTGVVSNLEKFADTERYGVRFYTMVFVLTALGMVVGALVPKLFKVSNYQTRAISLETGLRNSSLAMAIALLIQDAMGDFYSSLFFVAGIFGLGMYLAGLIAIKLYPQVLPVVESPAE